MREDIPAGWELEFLMARVALQPMREFHILRRAATHAPGHVIANPVFDHVVGIRSDSHALHRENHDAWSHDPVTIRPAVSTSATQLT